MTSELLWQTTALLLGLFVVGILACLPLFKWDVRAFFGSRLWVKIYWWWPIYAIFVFVLFAGWPAAVIFVSGLLVQACREWRSRHGSRSLIATIYLALFALAICQLLSILVFIPDPAAGVISICLASVLSDICAFFAGSYAGHHPLPRWINPSKSWEGVLGQIIGAFLGLGLASLTSAIDFSWGLALAIGIASATGDILNSIAKRRLDIKDWSQFIPGHGGVLDRFSSLSFALATGYVVLLLS
jgi:phosphatidate cytidylyltransferase